MSGYGIDPYGLGPYGGSAPPVILEVLTPDNGIVDVLGGDVITILGLNFADPMTAEILSGVFPYTLEAETFMFDARYDLTKSTARYGAPPMPAGTYHVRITTPSGTTVLVDAITYAPVSHELKVDRMRGAFASVWATGDRYLSPNAGV